MRANATYNELSPRVHAVMAINMRPRVATSSRVEGGRLPEGTLIEILDGNAWVRARIHGSGVVGIIDDSMHSAFKGWQLPVDVNGDTNGLGRKWRYAR